MKPRRFPSFLRRNAPTAGEPDALAALEQRLEAVEQHLRLLAIEPEIAAAQRALGRASDRVEAWDDLDAGLADWQAAVARWSAAVARLDPACTPATDPADSDELRAARTLLPPTVNLSSPDLRAAIAYIAQRERVVASWQRVETFRARITPIVGG